jgi:hypothetical protein
MKNAALVALGFLSVSFWLRDSARCQTSPAPPLSLTPPPPLTDKGSAPHHQQRLGANGNAQRVVATGDGQRFCTVGDDQCLAAIGDRWLSGADGDRQAFSTTSTR